MTENNETQNSNRPTRRLIQEKAFYKFDANGNKHRETETIEISRGWDQVGKENGTPYISWANTTIPVLPDADGKIVLRTFEINYEE